MSRTTLGSAPPMSRDIAKPWQPARLMREAKVLHNISPSTFNSG